MTALQFVILGLATWRLTSLFVDPEDADFTVLFAKLRYIVGIRYDKHSNPYASKPLAKWFICKWCMSLLIGIVSTVLHHVIGDIFVTLLLPFALSAISIATESMILKMTRGRGR